MFTDFPFWLLASGFWLCQTPPPSPPPTVQLPPVVITVTAPTPLPGIALTIDKVPSPVQTGTARELEMSGALDLSAFLATRFIGVHVNEVQGNPAQPDINYRGYTASPLLGTPQGLSVYLDGVRLNQPFGDVVSWDLIPRIAIQSTTLMPGSNPLFGLNTLGGALSVQTKDGRSTPGTTVQSFGGSNSRRGVELEHGGSRGRWDWYGAGNYFGEDGWRDSSPSDIRQGLAALGWTQGRRTVRTTLSFADNALTGNGLQEQRFLDHNYRSVYTKPDETHNKATLLNTTLRDVVSDRLVLSGNVYWRALTTRTLNGDLNDDSLDQSIYQPSAAELAALAAAGYTGVPASGATAANTPFPSWRCIANALLVDEPAEKCNGLLNRTNSRQRNGGLAGQFTWLSRPAGAGHQLTFGAAYDQNSTAFLQTSELGYLNPDRSVTGVGAFGDGVTGGDVDGAPYDTRVDLDGRVRTVSAYATDTFAVGARVHVTVSGRINRTRLENSDRITPAGDPGSLDGHHTFTRLNPAVGITFSPTTALNLYGGYSEGSRAPTSIELGCANPDQPCKLPNAMAGDPPLNQVVTRTFDGGVRLLWRGARWNAGVFRAGNDDDILFVTSDVSGFGYFRNFGQTRRQGIELGLLRAAGRISGGVNYTFLDATYRSAETVNGAGNSTSDAALAGLKGFEGVIEIEPGHKIPLVPAHTFKAFADVALTQALSVDLDLVAVSGSYARGNENNGHEPDGVYYLGAGRTSAYAVVNLGARYQVGKRLQLFVQVNNVFDLRYSTAAQLGATGFADDLTFVARPLPSVGGEFPIRQTTFFAPGAPRSAWAGVRLKF